MLLPQTLKWRADVCLDVGYSCCLGCYLSKKNLNDKTDSGLHWCLFTQRGHNSNPVGLLKIVMVEDGGFDILFCFSILKCSCRPTWVELSPIHLSWAAAVAITVWAIMPEPGWQPPGPPETGPQSGSPAGAPLDSIDKKLMSSPLFASRCNFRTQGFSECDSSSIALWGSHVQQFPRAQYFQSTYLCWTSYYW